MGVLKKQHSVGRVNLRYRHIVIAQAGGIWVRIFQSFLTIYTLPYTIQNIDKIWNKTAFKFQLWQSPSLIDQ